MLLGRLPIQSKDYTFLWQNSSLPVKAKLLLLQQVPTQRTPERERGREEGRANMEGDRQGGRHRDEYDDDDHLIII